MPVAPFDEAPSRDPEGRPLAYDLDPRCGRAYVPGSLQNSRDKLPDYPSIEGAGNRRSGEVSAGVGFQSGAHAIGKLPLAAAYGAGRLVWVDEAELFSWNGSNAQIDRKALGSFTLLPGRDALIARGWNCYLRSEQGLVHHNGMSGALSIVSQDRFSTACVWESGLAAAKEGSVLFFEGERCRQVTEAPFSVAALASSGALIAAFGASGHVATYRDGVWTELGDPAENGSFAQGWIVNGKVGIRSVKAQVNRVRYFDPTLPESPVLSFPVVSDTPLSVIPGRLDFEQHRLLTFVGGTDSHIGIHQPSESSTGGDKRPLGISALGSTIAVVKRSSEESAIVVAAEDTFEGKVHFHFLRDSKRPLPAPLLLPPGTTHTWLVPQAEGLLVLSYDGRRSIVNNVPFPA